MVIPTSSTSPAKGRGGFTLVEVMVAIGLVLLFGGLVLAVSSGRSDEAAWEEAGARLSAAAIAARAQAQRSGAVVALFAAPGPDGTTTLVARPVAVGGSDQEAEAEPDSRAIRGAEEMTELPVGVGLVATEPGGETPYVVGVRSVGPKTEAGAELPIAIFLPDGRCAAGRRFMTGKDGRAGLIRLNSWTGEASIERVEPKTDWGDGAGSSSTRSVPPSARTP